MGNAVLLSKQSGVGEILHGVLRFDFWDTDRLANQILAVAEQPALQTSLSQDVKAEFDHLSWAQVADKCHNMYNSLRRVEVTL